VTAQRTFRERGTALDRALVEAAGDGDINDIEELLRAGANVNGIVPGDGSPLIAAAGDGHVEAVRFLLNRGADPNLAVSGDGNPLIAAAGDGHFEVVRLLLDRGADPNAPVPGDGNALIAAAGDGHVNVVALLLDRRQGIAVKSEMEFFELAPRIERGSDAFAAQLSRTSIRCRVERFSPESV
jgi:ankyrin repeat protein